MMRELFESHAARQRRTGGAALSLAAHVAVVGAEHRSWHVRRVPLARVALRGRQLREATGPL